METVRRVTQFARSDGDYQWNVFEASVFGWTDSWMVIPIPGGDVAMVESLFYPSWLPHMCRGFCEPSPERRRAGGVERYKRSQEQTNTQLFLDSKSLAGELDWEPSEDILASGDVWLAAYCPAGRWVLLPWAFGFTKPESQRGKNSVWLPMESTTEDCRVYFQDGREHTANVVVQSAQAKGTKSQYQACVITETGLLAGIVNPEQNYHYWKASKEERLSQWLTLEI
tara:strand:- start:23644 stop:24321 length:678 start_codon:yes stop_codon:yes gene_type:complete